MGTLGIPEMMFIFVLALLLFGPKEVAGAGKDRGQGVGRIPSRAERAESYVRPRNEKPGAGIRIAERSYQ